MCRALLEERGAHDARPSWPQSTAVRQIVHLAACWCTSMLLCVASCHHATARLPPASRPAVSCCCLHLRASCSSLHPEGTCCLRALLPTSCHDDDRYYNHDNHFWNWRRRATTTLAICPSNGNTTIQTMFHPASTMPRTTPKWRDQWAKETSKIGPLQKQPRFPFCVKRVRGARGLCVT